MVLYALTINTLMWSFMFLYGLMLDLHAIEEHTGPHSPLVLFISLLLFMFYAGVSFWGLINYVKGKP